MPLQNRVTPFGELIATPERGLVYGNRGRLHDEHGGHPPAVAGEAVDLLPARVPRPPRAGGPMPPNRYTGLFFLDDATALAAGHRPCAECRNADYRSFLALTGAFERRRPRRAAARGTRAPARGGAGRPPRRRVRGARRRGLARRRLGSSSAGRPAVTPSAGKDSAAESRSSRRRRACACWPSGWKGACRSSTPSAAAR